MLILPIVNTSLFRHKSYKCNRTGYTESYKQALGTFKVNSIFCSCQRFGTVKHDMVIKLLYLHHIKFLWINVVIIIHCFHIPLSLNVWIVNMYSV